MSMTKMDLTEFRSYTLKGVGLGGLDASHGVGWVSCEMALHSRAMAASSKQQNG